MSRDVLITYCNRFSSTVEYVSLEAPLMRLILFITVLVANCEAQSCSLSSYAATVSKITLTNCSLTSIDTSELKRFTNLQVVWLDTNRLTTLPDMTPVASTLAHFNLANNQISDVSDGLIQPLNSLVTFSLNRNRLTTFPDVLSSASTLTKLHLQKNKIREIGDNALFALINLERLWLHLNAELTRFPHPVRGLRTITSLIISDTGISHLPPILHENITLLELVVSRSVDVCRCDNAWLKQEAPKMASFQYNDVHCDDRLWSSMTVLDMKAKCAQERTQKVKQLAHAKAVAAAIPLSPFLLHAYEPGVQREQCVLSCLDAPGCVSLYWRELDDPAVDCVLLAPGNSIEVADVPDGNLDVWTYVALT